MVEREINIKTTREFCDFCNEMETYPRFHKCMICGRSVCPKCEIKIIPLTFREAIVCKDCLTPEIEEIKDIRIVADELYKRIDELCKHEQIIVTKLRDRRLGAV